MSTKLLTGADVNNQRITAVGSPTAGTDATNKDYVDGLVRGLDWKQEVVAASTGNVSLAAPGTTLDGVTLVAQDRILLKDQTAPAENGIYVWTASGSALTRALDADSATELSGATVTVQRGTVNADRVYRVTTDDPLALGTTAIALAQIGAGGTAYTAGNGLTMTGSTIDVVAGTGLAVAADSVSIDTAVVTRKTAANSAAAASTTVTHSWNTRDVQVTVYENSGSYQEVLPDVFHNLNDVVVTFPAAVTAGQYRIVVQG